jgi:hypothetical protein
LDSYLNYLKINSKHQIEFHSSLGFEKLENLSDYRKKQLHEAKVTFFPVFQHCHFTLLVVTKSDKLISYYDPLGNSAPDKIKSIIQKEFPDYKFENVKFQHQKDGVNCLLFVLVYCAHYAMDSGKNSIKEDKKITSSNMFGLRKVFAQIFHPQFYLKENVIPFQYKPAEFLKKKKIKLLKLKLMYSR